MNSSVGSTSNSSHDDDIAANDSRGLGEFSGAPENNQDVDDEDDEEELDEEASSLPRPPTKPNVPIDDPTICPVCTQSGMYVTCLLKIRTCPKRLKFLIFLSIL